jgi:hypothetical protein
MLLVIGNSQGVGSAKAICVNPVVASSWVLGKTNHNKNQDNLLSSMKTPIITFFIHATIGLWIHWANGSRC